MGPLEYRPTGGICGYCRARNEEKRRSRSSVGACTGPCRQHSYAKLSKPPKVQTRREKPRNRLRKLDGSTSSIQLPEITYVLQSEPYPYSTSPGELLGVFSNIDSVTAAAIDHGAYSFSRKGLMDGCEYLSPTGRIKIIPKEIVQNGVEATVQVQKNSGAAGDVRSRPQSQLLPSTHAEPRSRVYLAIHQAPDVLLCIGVFAKKNTAWGACLKTQAMFALSHKLREVVRASDQHGMPVTSGRVVGRGIHQWLVRPFEIERLPRRSN